ncbi:hypothetical protein EWM64_g2054 [Hericium alpestre]|uniref:MYND-type domain-containing protein n=1 Tax=Hericium alpestre TaxID=135208 RepID=A0A4Z0A661_9AGAM|nr:hypothetical protein EWM64_g2054 [Hericium alpestre]
MIPSTPPKLARILLEHGANVNHQNRYGGSPIVGAFMAGHSTAVDVLMEYGADLTIADADGHVTGDRYHNYGPAVTAVVAKWLRKRAGEQAPPLDGKKCDFCEKTGGELKMCAACHSARYCSSSCQRSHWKTHKQTCKSFTPANTITLKPNYEGHRNTVPIADLTRNVMGITGAPSIQAHHLRGVHQPSSYPKTVIIKVQVPLAGNGGLYVYTKKRDFVCSVLRKDNPSGYDRISQVIREKGVGRAKGYFADNNVKHVENSSFDNGPSFNSLDKSYHLTPFYWMRELLEPPGMLGENEGAQELRERYRAQTMRFNYELLNEFAFHCYTGSPSNMRRMLNTGEAPPMSRAETPFEFGYATLIIAGSQRIRHGPPGACLHEEALRFLLEQGCPPDVEDICGYTALHHATMIPSTPPKLARILLEHGANVNHQSRYGGSPIVGAFMEEHSTAVDVLMEYGADLTLVDANGYAARENYAEYGPAVTAVVAKWLKKRAGEEALPLDGKKCEFCYTTDGGLKMCAACRTVRYCSSSCQRNHWKTHKETCKPFTPANTVTLKPNYEGQRNMIPIADLTRNVMGITGAPSMPAHHLRGVHQPSSYPKKVVIKVQVPLTGNLALLLYTKKRDFVCSVHRMDNPSGYDRLTQMIRQKGVAGAKGYFIEKGCPPDVEDICKYTALHHASLNPGTSPELVRILLEHGANVNHQNCFGVSPVVCAFMGGHDGAVDVLMEFGADLTLLEADGHVAGDHYVDYGPRVTAVVAKWLRKRAGEQPPPLDGKKCDFCGKMDSGDLKLKACSACHSARYCSSSCQKNHWKAHKLTCKPFTPANTVTLKPNYTEIPLTHLVPTADWARNVLGVTGAPSTPAHHQRGARHPSSYPKKVIIKVQVPISEDSQSLLIYTKKRDFVCTVNRKDGPSGYDRISQVIKDKGVGGKKGYFAGELKNAYELVVKVGEMLAEQPW